MNHDQADDAIQGKPANAPRSLQDRITSALPTTFSSSFQPHQRKRHHGRNPRGPGPRPTGITKRYPKGARSDAKVPEQEKRGARESKVQVTDEERAKVSDEKLGRKLERIEEGGREEYSKLWKGEFLVSFWFLFCS